MPSLHFIQRAAGKPARLGILSGTFNPVTVAHMALAAAAQSEVDELVFVLPRVFPHKHYSGASFEERVDMLRTVLHSNPAYSIATTDDGLFADIAQACRKEYGSGTTLHFLCGRDAAERIVEWDYGKPGAIGEMLRDFNLLVAARGGEYSPPPELAHAVRSLELPPDFDRISATDIRDRIARGDQWEHLVPPGVEQQVRRIYSST